MKNILKTANDMLGSSTRYKDTQVIDLSDMEDDDITSEIEKTLAECAKVKTKESKNGILV